MINTPIYIKKKKEKKKVIFNAVITLYDLYNLYSQKQWYHNPPSQASKSSNSPV